jgi:tRNA (cmo5U34)-methyltransferase
VVDTIYERLNWGGGFLLFEKVRACDARFQETMMLSEVQAAAGFRRRWSPKPGLKGVLEPFSTQGNLDLLKRAGFVDVISIVKCVCFGGLPRHKVRPS